MRSYELYLDESGKFINEKQAISPSLIGGILVKKGDLNIKLSQDMMKTVKEKVDGNYVHINDLAQKDKKLAGTAAVDIMEELRNIPANIVIFENNELLDFKDDKLLYLNIITEGIVNLLEKLSLEKSDTVELNIIAAVRRDLKVDDNKTVIELEEYSKRIKERIYMKFAEKDIFLSKNCKVNFELSSARKNSKLMLADVVCNTRLTRNSNKFNEEQKKTLERIFNSSRYIFNVFRTNIQKKLSYLLIQNNIVDAIFLINEVDDEKTKKELINLIINNINTMPLSNLKIQLELLSLKIRSLIDVQRNLLLCEKFLLDLQENIIGKIKVKGFIINKLKLDVSLYLLTIYTHLGNNIKSKKQIEISSKEIKSISGSFEFLDYYYILKIREAIYYNTCFQNEKIVEVLTEAIEKYEKILQTIASIEEFETVKSDMLAKAVGTRLQAYISLITPNIDEKLKQEYYERAVKDSDYAIDQFATESDKRRQYQYRCMLEISVGNVDKSIRYLMKVLGINEVNFDKFLEVLDTISDFSKNFIIVNYLDIMQYAINNNNALIGIKMYESFKNNNNIYNEYVGYFFENQNEVLFENNVKVIGIHPFEMIYWNLAKYFKRNNKDLANVFYDKAIEICREINEPAIYVVELAIEADKLTVSKDINKDKIKFIDKYKVIMGNDEFLEIHEFLNKFLDEFQYIELSDEDSEIKEAAKIIADGIKI